MLIYYPSPSLGFHFSSNQQFREDTLVIQFKYIVHKHQLKIIERKTRTQLVHIPSNILCFCITVLKVLYCCRHFQTLHQTLHKRMTMSVSLLRTSKKFALKLSRNLWVICSHWQTQNSSWNSTKMLAPILSSVRNWYVEIVHA